MLICVLTHMILRMFKPALKKTKGNLGLQQVNLGILNPTEFNGTYSPINYMAIALMLFIKIAIDV